MGDRRGSGEVTSGMKPGGYYDLHSEYQRRVVEGGDPAIRSLVAGGELGIDPAFVVVDYGAGTGATSVHAIGTAILALRERNPELPVWAIHNDVLSNDFTQLFRAIAAPGGYLGLPGGPVLAAAAGGSFYSPVVPSATVHLGMCSNAAHWYREQPRVELVDGIYFSDANGAARARLAAQAAHDWLGFLGARAFELAPGGRLIVQGIATTTDDDGGELVSAQKLLRVMYEVALELTSEGELDPDALSRYVFPVYCRTVEEATAPMGEGAPLTGEFDLLGAPVEKVSNPYWEMLERDGDRRAYAQAYTAFVRAFSESTLIEHLFTPGARDIDVDRLCEEFFARFEAATAADPDRGRYEAWILRLSLERASCRP